MPPLRLPRLALPALQTRIDEFMAALRALTGSDLGPDHDTSNLAGFLLAALHYTHQEHAGPAHPATAHEPFTVDALVVASALARRLDEVLLAGPLLPLGCLEALQGAVPFEVVDAPCVPRTPPPCVYPWSPEATEPSSAFPSSPTDAVGVVAGPGWLRRDDRRDEVFRAVLPANDERLSFAPLDGAAALALARALLARRELDDAPPAVLGGAPAFVRLFGDATRAYAPRDLDPRDPLRDGTSWSRYDRQGNGSWGRTASLLVSDGWRVAFLEHVWDVASE